MARTVSHGEHEQKKAEGGARTVKAVGGAVRCVLLVWFMAKSMPSGLCGGVVESVPRGNQVISAYMDYWSALLLRDGAAQDFLRQGSCIALAVKRKRMMLMAGLTSVQRSKRAGPCRCVVRGR